MTLHAISRNKRLGKVLSASIYFYFNRYSDLLALAEDIDDMKTVRVLRGRKASNASGLSQKYLKSKKSAESDSASESSDVSICRGFWPSMLQSGKNFIINLQRQGSSWSKVAEPSQIIKNSKWNQKWNLHQNTGYYCVFFALGLLQRSTTLSISGSYLLIFSFTVLPSSLLYFIIM